ncbi:hypothetical protein J8I87_37260, partial [Paraburkholderia sp. LEh10]|uniref:hypothetical protein n=1 Tax=Paraburkholderia sp. LEh10 TaxID=2821353 RepID=UPI001AE27385
MAIIDASFLLRVMVGFLAMQRLGVVLGGACGGGWLSLCFLRLMVHCLNWFTARSRGDLGGETRNLCALYSYDFLSSRRVFCRYRGHPVCFAAIAGMRECGLLCRYRWRPRCASRRGRRPCAGRHLLSLPRQRK